MFKRCANSHCFKTEQTHICFCCLEMVLETCAIAHVYVVCRGLLCSLSVLFVSAHIVSRDRVFHLVVSDTQTNGCSTMAQGISSFVQGHLELQAFIFASALVAQGC